MINRVILYKNATEPLKMSNKNNCISQSLVFGYEYTLLYNVL